MQIFILLQLGDSTEYWIKDVLKESGDLSVAILCHDKNPVNMS